MVFKIIMDKVFKNYGLLNEFNFKPFSNDMCSSL
jgi:hypothetical protein